MNAFEDIVAQYLEEEGYWVRQSVKVDILSEDKQKIGTPTMPRPEIDIVALNMGKNELLLVEVKSLLNSYGVHFEAVSGKAERDKRGYKLFHWDLYRKIITERLIEEYLEQGLINKNTKINYALAAGHINSEWDEDKIKEYFSHPERKWILFSPKDIKNKIKNLSEKGWEDNLVVMTAKLTQGE